MTTKVTSPSYSVIKDALDNSELPAHAKKELLESGVDSAKSSDALYDKLPSSLESQMRSLLESDAFQALQSYVIKEKQTNQTSSSVSSESTTYEAADLASLQRELIDSHTAQLALFQSETSSEEVISLASYYDSIVKRGHVIDSDLIYPPFAIGSYEFAFYPIKLGDSIQITNLLRKAFAGESNDITVITKVMLDPPLVKIYFNYITVLSKCRTKAYRITALDFNKLTLGNPGAVIKLASEFVQQVASFLSS